jgi:RHH-type rel operon transcriptional repressor/antitoxin RelB
MSTGVVSVRLPDDLKSRLDRLSEATGRSAAFYIREALSEHLDDLEWAYGIAVVAAESRAGRTTPRPLDSLLDDLGLTREELGATPEP